MKFAGDAMIVLWGEAGEDEPLASLVRRAAQCGTQILRLRSLISTICVRSDRDPDRRATTL